MTATSPLTAACAFTAKSVAVRRLGTSGESGQPPFGDHLLKGVELAEASAAKTGTASGPWSSARGFEEGTAERKADDANAGASLAPFRQPPASPLTPVAPAAPDGLAVAIGPETVSPQTTTSDGAEAIQGPTEQQVLPSAISECLPTSRAPFSRCILQSGQELPRTAVSTHRTSAGTYRGGRDDAAQASSEVATSSAAVPNESGGAVAGADSSLMPSPLQAANDSILQPVAQASPAVVIGPETIAPQAATADSVPTVQRPTERGGLPPAISGRLQTPRTALFRGVLPSGPEIPQDALADLLNGASAYAGGQGGAAQAGSGVATSSTAVPNESGGAVAGASLSLMPSPLQTPNDSSFQPAAQASPAIATGPETTAPQASAVDSVPTLKRPTEWRDLAAAIPGRLQTPRTALLRGGLPSGQEIPQAALAALLNGASAYRGGQDRAAQADSGVATSSLAVPNESGGAVAGADSSLMPSPLQAPNDSILQPAVQAGPAIAIGPKAIAPQATAADSLTAASPGGVQTPRTSPFRGVLPSGQEIPQAALADLLNGASASTGGQGGAAQAGSGVATSSPAALYESGGAVAGADLSLMPAPQASQAVVIGPETTAPQATATNGVPAVERPTERPSLSRAVPARLQTPRTSPFRGVLPSGQVIPQAALAALLTGASAYRGGQEGAAQAGSEVAAPQPAATHEGGGAAAGTGQPPTPAPLQAAGQFNIQPVAPDAAPAPGGIAVAVRLEARTDAHAGNANQDASGGARERTPFPREFQPVAARDAADGTAAQSSPARAGLWAVPEVPSQSAPRAAAETPTQPAKDLNPPDARFEPSPNKVSAPLKDISIQVGQTPENRVELRVTERAGELRVAVRAADPEMAHSLRQALPELVNRLDDHGFRTEAWRPAGIVSASGPLSAARESSSNSRNGDPQPQSGSSREQGGQRDHNQSDRPRWVAELESSLEGGQER